MRILLSAYACEPNKGSEPGVGWGWAVELAKLGHEVYVITRANNEEAITIALKDSPYDKLHFIYYDVPKGLSWWKKGGRGIHLYYFLWQIGIYAVARSLIKKRSFDVIHHVTFVSIRQPSFLGLLGIPFIFGPVAGGESIPIRLRKSFPLRGKIIDGLRDIVNAWVKFSPLMHITFHTAKIIYVTSEETYRLIPKRFHKKAIVKLAIASSGSSLEYLNFVEYKGPPRVVYVGNLLFLKGVHLALKSFALLLTTVPDSRLTILGKGADKLWLKNMSVELGIDHAVEWLDWLPRCEVDSIYQKNDLLLFPSLRDSGGMVVLEAMQNGLPVICLNLGGPGVIVEDECGYKIDTNGKTELMVTDDLALALRNFFCTPDNIKRMSRRALLRNNEMGWCRLVQSVYRNLK